MALSAHKHATTIILDADMNRLLDAAARQRGLSRSELIRHQLRLFLEQFRAHPQPRSAGAVRGRRVRSDETALFRSRAVSESDV